MDAFLTIKIVDNIYKSSATLRRTSVWQEAFKRRLDVWQLAKFLRCPRLDDDREDVLSDATVTTVGVPDDSVTKNRI